MTCCSNRRDVICYRNHRRVWSLPTFESEQIVPFRDVLVTILYMHVTKLRRIVKLPRKNIVEREKERDNLLSDEEFSEKIFLPMKRLIKKNSMQISPIISSYFYWHEFAEYFCLFCCSPTNIIFEEKSALYTLHFIF